MSPELPLILYDASTTHDAMNAVKADGREAREAICVETLASAPVSSQELRKVCGCFVAEVDRRGLTAQSIGDDTDRLQPIMNSCVRKHVEA